MENKEYKPNSNAYKEKLKEEAREERRVEKVVSAASTKKNRTRSFVNTFISEEAKNIKDYAISDVVIPTIKNAIVDIVCNGVTMIFGTRGGQSRTSGGSKISYSGFYDQRNNSGRWAESKTGSRFDYDDIVYKTRADAESVLMQMEDELRRYGVVRVADMYDMSELTPPYTSNRYGWTSVRNAEIKRIPEGYIIKLPQAAVID